MDSTEKCKFAESKTFRYVFFIATVILCSFKHTCVLVDTYFKDMQI